MLLVLSVVLAACQSKSEQYELSSILPSPVTPGSLVTAFGTLPKDAKLTLDNAKTLTKSTVGGLQFTVPETSDAGNVVVKIEAGQQTFTGTVQVQPVIETTSVSGQMLELRGKGWSAQTSDLELYLSGVKVQPVKVDKGFIQVSLPTAETFGAVEIQLVVNQQTSRSISLVREAGSLTGKVIFPAQPTQPAPMMLEQTAVPTPRLDTLVVQHETGALDSYLLAAHQSVEATHLAPLQMTRLVFASEDEARAALDMLGSLAGVSSVAFDEAVRAEDFEAVALSNREVVTLDEDAQWHLPLIGVREAWQVTKGAGVVVAVVDTGVVLNHPDLITNLLPGYDFVDNDTQPSDASGHGTHVAGLIAANGKVHGTAPEAKLLPVRVLPDTSGGSAFAVAQGILWAAGLLESPANPNPAQVINLSLGTSSFSQTISSALTQVLEKGVVVVAAAGNSGGNLAYPAAQQGVIAVTALAGPKTAYQPWYASRGMGTWLTAYGGDKTQDQNRDGQPDGILSSYLVNGEPGYAYDMGTSMAAPQVAGLAALALASGTPASLVKDTLANTTTELGIRGYDTTYGFGLAVGRTVTAASPRSYVVVMNEAGKVVGWSLVQTDTTFTLNNLTPNSTITVFAASDEDGDGVLAEAGELRSQTLSLSIQSSSSVNVTDLLLNPTGGSVSVTLEARL